MKILITGYGKMGRMVEELAQQKGWEILAALDGQDASCCGSLKKADVAVDFSHPAMLEPLANYIRRTGTPLISGTTGYSEEQMDVLRQLGKSAAGFVFGQLQPGRCPSAADIGKFWADAAGRF